MLADRMIEVRSVKDGNRLSFTLHFNRAVETDPASWWMKVDESNLNFRIPSHLLGLWSARGRTLGSAAELKVQKLNIIDLVGPVRSEHGSTVRHLMGSMSHEQITKLIRMARRGEVGGEVHSD